MMIDDKPDYYTQRGFAPERVFHGFFTRRGGVSAAPYDSLNCGVGSSDDAVHVARNRALVAQQAGVEAGALLSVFQVHGHHVVHAHAPWTDRPEGDAMVSDQAGIGLGILTADCAPVLFAGVKSDGAPVIGAAHAGWKGALSGVLDQTVHAMSALGAARISACVGPCIGKASYEVQTDFTAPFLEENEESERFFHSAPKDGHALFDLAGYCAWRLARAGIGDVFLSDRDTYSNETDFFSYRRAVHRDETDYGRQISVIAIPAK